MGPFLPQLPAQPRTPCAGLVGGAQGMALTPQGQTWPLITPCPPGLRGALLVWGDPAGGMAATLHLTRHSLGK